MKIFRERQDQFIADMEMFDNWSDRFNYMISLADELPAECPEYLLKYRLENCTSKTCFKAYKDGNIIYVDGWSNSPVMAGIIVSMMKIFNWSEVREIQDTTIDFYTKTGLIDNLTQMRRDAIIQMISRIIVLLK